jgi:hypothetical protein
MSEIKANLEKMKYDTRLIELNIKNGRVTKEEIQNHMQNLEDDSGKAQPLDLEGKSGEEGLH